MNWKYTKIHRLEVQALANGGTRSKTRSGIKIIASTALGGNAIALYINLRGRAYYTNTGRLKFLVFASQIGLAQDLGWDLDEAPQRITNAIRQLVEAGFITRYIPDDDSTEAREIRKIIGQKYRYNRTNIYELVLFKKIYYGGHFNKNTKIKTKGKGKKPSLPFSGAYLPFEPVSSNKPPPVIKQTLPFDKTKAGVCYNKGKEEGFTIRNLKKNSIIDMNKEEEEEENEEEVKHTEIKDNERDLYIEFKEIAFNGCQNWSQRTTKEILSMKFFLHYFDLNDWHRFMTQRAEYEARLDQKSIEWLDKQSKSLMGDREV